MTRKTDGGSNNIPTKAAASSLKNLRSQIDKLDLQILELVNKRASLASEIGRVKNDAGSEIFNPSREEEVLENVLSANKGPLEAPTLRAIFREIMSGSRALQKMVKIAYLGPEYSFSHLAAVERFGHSVELVPVASIAAVFEAVNRGNVDLGVVPLENSTDGRVADTMEMFIRLPQVKICAEVRVLIHHNLMAKCDQADIRRVYSKPQALSQCRNWLIKNVPQASQHDVSSTTAAAELALREPGAAAVASREAALRYSLRILAASIEDVPNNETRFAVIGTAQCDKTGDDKTALMFKLPHHPGSLVDALNTFKSHKLNLTWIESFPARSGKNDKAYVFFVDFEGHVEDPKVKKVITALEEYCDEVSILGSFPADKDPALKEKA